MHAASILVAFIVGIVLPWSFASKVAAINRNVGDDNIQHVDTNDSTDSKPLENTRTHDCRDHGAGNVALADRYRAPRKLSSRLGSSASHRLLDRRHPVTTALAAASEVRWQGLYTVVDDERNAASLDSIWPTPRVLWNEGWEVAATQVDDDALRSHADRFIRRHGQPFGASLDQLIFDEVRHHRSLRSVRYRQEIDGVPVHDSSFAVTFFQASDALTLVRVDSLLCTSLRASTSPRLDPAAAVHRARQWIGSRAIRTSKPELIFYPNSTPSNAVLAYRLNVVAGMPFADYEVVLDATTGDCLACFDTVCYADITGTIEARITPGLLPDLPSNPPVATPIEGLTIDIPGVGFAITDAAGSFTIPHNGTDPVTVDIELLHPFVDVEQALGIDFNATLELTPGVPETFVLNDMADPAVTAQFNGFVHTLNVHDFVKSIDPDFVTLDFPIPCVVNQTTSTCNAFYNNGQIFFALSGSSASGGQCVNTAYSTIIYHEYGHAILDLAYGFTPGAYHEGMADSCSVLLTGDPNVGLQFEDGDVLRNVDTTDRSYPEHVNGEAHDAGLILAGSFWDTFVALESDIGSSEALNIVRELWLKHMIFGTGEISPLLAIDVLMIDDDDGNLLNGTPHYDAIAAGFSAHGLAPPALQFFTFAADLPNDTTNQAGPYPVSIGVESTTGESIVSVEVLYSVDGASFTTVPLSTSTPGQYVGDIPGQVAPSCVELFFSATDALGRTATYPATAPDRTFLFLVGEPQSIYLALIGDDDDGFTHGADAGQDDWQRGLPNIQGNNPWDPLAAHSQLNVWGNDLNNFGWNGDYTDNTDNQLSLPPIDCSGQTDVKLRYRRWLTVEKAPFDIARVVVEDAVVWENGTEVDHLDDAWVLVTHDVSDLADGNPAVDIRFELSTNNAVEYGGWNLDDIELFSLGPITSPEFRRGDCNGDTALDIADAVFLLASLFDAGADPSCEDACDANDDGTLNLDDALLMLDAFLLEGGSLPMPYPLPGVDPSADTLACPSS